MALLTWHWVERIVGLVTGAETKSISIDIYIHMTSTPTTAILLSTSIYSEVTVRTIASRETVTVEAPRRLRRLVTGSIHPTRIISTVGCRQRIRNSANTVTVCKKLSIQGIQYVTTYTLPKK